MNIYIYIPVDILYYIHLCTYVMQTGFLGRHSISTTQKHHTNKTSKISIRYHLVPTSNVLKVLDKDLEKLQTVRHSGRWSSAPDLQALARIAEATNDL